MVVRVAVGLPPQLEQMNVVDHDQRCPARPRAFEHQLRQLPGVRVPGRPHPEEGQQRVVEPFDRWQRIDVDVDDRQVLVAVACQLAGWRCRQRRS